MDRGSFTNLDTEYALDIEFEHRAAVVGGEAGQYSAERRDTVSLHLWLTHGLHGRHYRDRVLVIHPSSLTGDRVRVRLPLELHMNRSINETVARAERLWALPGARALTVDTHKHELPANVQLRVAQYVETATESGLTCRVDAGSAGFLLSELDAATSTITRSIVMRTGDDGDLAKGSLVVRRVRAVHVASDKRVRLDFERARDFQWFPRESRPEDFSRLQDRCDTIVKRSLALYYDTAIGKALVYEFAAANGARCPLYTLDAMRLPAATYLLHVPLGDNGAGVYRQSLRAALTSNDSRAVDLLAVAQRQFATRDRMLASTPRLVDTMANMFAVVTHAMTVYENDFVVARTGEASISENFKEAEMEDGVDCEDSGKMNAKLAMQFERTRFPGTDALDRLLRTYQELLFTRRWYQLGLIMPAVVTNKNLDARNIDADSIAAHTFAVAVPTRQLRERIVDYPGAEPLAARALAAREFGDYKVYERAWHVDLPFLVMEGTAPADSLPLPVGAYYEDLHSREYAAAARAIVERRVRVQTRLIEVGLPAAVQIDASQRSFGYTEEMRAGTEDTSAFYKIVATLVVRSSAGTMSFGAFTRRDDGVLAAGVAWSELTTSHRDSRVRFVPEYALDELEGAIIDDALLQAEPVPALTYTERLASHSMSLDGAPRPLVDGLSALFGVDVEASPPARPTSTSVLARELDVMPLPPAVVVLRARLVDIENDGAAQREIVAAFAATRDQWASVRVERYYFADTPVMGESELHAIEAVHIYGYLSASQ